MLRALFAGDSPAPNAAVNATASKRGQLLMGVELRTWHYDARARRLSQAPITIFNSSSTRLTRTVNDGPEIDIPYANDPLWSPTSTTVGFRDIDVHGQVVLPLFALTVTLPGNIQYGDVQLYLFLGSGEIVWTVLNYGHLVASKVVPARPVSP